MDAVKEAESIGIPRNYATNYDFSIKGVCDSYTTLNCVATSARCDTLSDDFNLSSTYTKVSNSNK
jgi:hypothetical protein